MSLLEAAEYERQMNELARASGRLGRYATFGHDDLSTQMHIAAAAAAARRRKGWLL